MVQFIPVAQVLNLAQFEGLPEEQRPKGQTVQEVLSRAGADEFVDVPVPTSVRQQLHGLAVAMRDATISVEADVATRQVPIGHLRRLAPETLVLLGVRVKYTEAESRFLKDV